MSIRRASVALFEVTAVQSAVVAFIFLSIKFLSFCFMHTSLL